MSKELVKKDVPTSQALEFQVEDSALLDLMSEDAKNYVDETSTDDMLIPRINILQGQSKQVKKSSPEKIEGAEEGDFFNSATNEIYKGDLGFYFVPVKRRIVYLEWRDIAKGGGLVNNFSEDASAYNTIIPDADNRHMTSPETEIVKTYEVYGYQIDMATKKYNQVILSLAKTQVKKMKKWNTVIRTLVDKTGRQIPEYAGIYKLTTVPESNDKGDWFNFEITFMGYTLAIPEIGKIIYDKSKEFANMIKESQIKVNYSEEESDSKTTQSELI